MLYYAYRLLFPVCRLVLSRKRTAGISGYFKGDIDLFYTSEAY